MNKYRVRFSNDHGGKISIHTVDAENEQEAFLKAVKEAESQGKHISDEVWSNTIKLN